MIAAALLAAPPSSSSSSSSSKPTFTVTTTTTSSTAAAAVAAMKTTEQQVRTLIPVTTSDGSKLFVSGPCIVLKTQTPTTVAQQMQALRPLLKSDTNSNNNKNNSSVISKTGMKKKANSDSNNGSSTGSRIGSTSTDTQQKSPGGSDVENEPEALRCKRRIDFATLGLPRPQPAAMARRNERERNRVKQVNMGFETLRQHVPQGRKNKKLSKVDTLKEAAKYIKQLHQLLLDADKDCDESLTSAVADTITIVSRPSHTTTISTTTNSKISTDTNTATVVPSSSSPQPAETVTTESTATNTATITEADLLQLAASAMDTSAFSCEENNHLHQQHRSRINQMVSEPVDFQPSNADCVVLDVDSSSLVESGLNHPDVDFEAVAHQLTSNVHNFVGSVSPPMAVGNLVIGNGSPADFLELAPAQLDFVSQQSSPHHHSPIPSTPTITTSAAGTTTTTTNPAPMEVEQVNAPLSVPSNFLLASFGASSSSTNPINYPARHFVDFHHHHHNSSSSSNANSCVTSSTSTTPSSESSSPIDSSPAELGGIGFQYPRKNQRGCGGSEGSCPVSPSESNGSSSEVSHEDGLGMYGGETWQDLSADIAEWLCSKIDIEDPDVFV